MTQLHLGGDNDEASSRNGSDLKRASYCVRGELKDERQFASTAYQIDTRHLGHVPLSLYWRIWRISHTHILHTIPNNPILSTSSILNIFEFSRQKSECWWQIIFGQKMVVWNNVLKILHFSVTISGQFASKYHYMRHFASSSMSEVIWNRNNFRVNFNQFESEINEDSHQVSGNVFKIS